MWMEFLLAVGVMSLMMGFLTVLMLVAEATIANYGDVKLFINGKKELRVAGGRSLLATLKDAKVFIPSACGGRGSCGLCKVKLIQPTGEPMPTELPWLSADEIKGNVRLSCQCKVKTDFSLLIPDELLRVTQSTTRVTAIRDLTHDIKEVRLQIVDPPTLEFRAGQFVQFEVPPYELTDLPVYRAYSVASDPKNTGEIELEIRYVPNGICTTYVHRHLKVGAAVTINGPYGEFYLRDTERRIVFIAGGSGMAPIKAILHEMINRKCTRSAIYFFGARSRRDLFLVDELRAMEQVLPGFQFVPALSEPQPQDEWTGETGLITAVVDRHVQSVENTEAYLCGSPLMIDACIKVLKAKGMPDELIYYDKFA